MVYFIACLRKGRLKKNKFLRRKLIYKRRRELKKSLEKITESETLKFVLFISRLNL